MLPKERPNVQTQFLIFTLFGDYILPREGRIWAGSLLYLMNLLGVSERATRSTLSRMSHKGWIKAYREGRRSQYTLTVSGWSLLKQGAQRIFEPLFTDWNGKWFMVVYSLPEEIRGQRHQLRQHLTWLGFGSLTPGCWISPHNRQNELEPIFDDLDVKPYVELFNGVHLGNSSDCVLVERCWDLQGLEEQYQQFLKHYQKEYQYCLQKSNGELGLSLEECFVRRFWLTHEFQSFPLKDPNLPTRLLLPDWIGFQARELFDLYRGLLENHANKFIDSVLSDDFVPAENSNSVIRTG